MAYNNLYPDPETDYPTPRLEDWENLSDLEDLLQEEEK